MKINIPRKVLYGVAAPALIVYIALNIHVYVTNDSKYYSENPDEALSEFYIALAEQLKNNPNTEFINKLSESYRDKVIDDEEFMALARIQIEQKKLITVSYKEKIVFDDAKAKFAESWEKYQNENPVL
ncbi:hypothetical protein [Pseudoalteromonas gelatinilytica]|uniref:Uncharacterized protein n=1 Tax=Pseudoalteromonas gelatinilytica TaxID=1703256 RepID=A0ABQ1TS12_9GAMM|nr:hypothetical protein [Pseudoalteromonas profundi]MBL4706091.1 hypothetical protein [Flavobacteriales bacterium]GGF00735.1 hypothetical protein GCM10008027_27050 [Pseudoalteromonas profundi]